MDELNLKHRIEVKRWPRQYVVDRTPMIRLYKSSPESATLQLRGEKAWATADYLGAAQMRELIAKLQEIVAAIEPKPVAPFNMFARREPWFWPLPDDEDERGSEG
jgi:hypothetical protein